MNNIYYGDGRSYPPWTKQPTLPPSQQQQQQQQQGTQQQTTSQRPRVQQKSPEVASER